MSSFEYTVVIVITEMAFIGSLPELNSPTATEKAHVLFPFLLWQISFAPLPASRSIGQRHSDFVFGMAAKQYPFHKSSVYPDTPETSIAPTPPKPPQTPSMGPNLAVCVGAIRLGGIQGHHVAGP